MTATWKASWIALVIAAAATGCAHHRTLDMGPEHDPPFPLGAVTDAHWETQQTNAEAADFIMYDHEFQGDTAELTPGAKRHLEQMAMRMDHVPFPIVIERSVQEGRGRLDRLRREAVVEHLAQMGAAAPDRRVVVAPAFPEGITSVEAAQSYGNVVGSSGATFGRRFGGSGGTYR